MANDPADGPMEMTLVKGVWRLVGITEPTRMRWWAELHLTMAQVRLLFVVAGQPGVTVGQLADEFGVRSPTITGHIDRLVAAGLVCRRERAADRRVIEHFVTGEGEQALLSVKREAAELVERVTARMTDSERESLLAGVRAFARAGAELGLQVVSGDQADAATVRTMGTVTGQ